MRIIFCDDDSKILEQLQKYVLDFFHTIGAAVPQFAAYSSGDELLANEALADIAFLDVEMPGLSGIETGAVLKKANPKIIIFIITSYRHYLDEAMQEQVFRFLDKPIDKSRLFRNLKDAIRKYNMETKEIPVETELGLEVFKADEIVCIESNRRKTILYTTNAVIDTRYTVEKWMDVLNLPSFFSSHRGIIINMRYIFKISKDSIYLKFGEQQKIVYLARRKYTEFKNRYLLYLESIK